MESFAPLIIQQARNIIRHREREIRSLLQQSERSTHSLRRLTRQLCDEWLRLSTFDWAGSGQVEQVPSHSTHLKFNSLGQRVHGTLTESRNLSTFFRAGSEQLGQVKSLGASKCFLLVESLKQVVDPVDSTPSCLFSDAASPDVARRTFFERSPLCCSCWDESGSLPRPIQLFVQPPNFLRLTLRWQDKACAFNKGQSFQKLLVLHPYNMKRTMWSEPNQAPLSKTHRTPAAVLQWTREHRGGADLAAARQNHAAGHKGSAWLFWNKSKVNKFERKISLQLACLACCPLY